MNLSESELSTPSENWTLGVEPVRNFRTGSYVASGEVIVETISAAPAPYSSNIETGALVPIPTAPVPSTTNGVVSPETSSILKARLLVPVA